MKIEHLKVVNDLITVREKCEKALDNAKNFVDVCEKDELRNIFYSEYSKVFNGFYNGSLGEYRDGSGEHVSLSGCYVTKQVALATITILVEQIQTIDEDLKELGVII